MNIIITDRLIFLLYLFNSIMKVPFEDIGINVPKDYDTYLKIIYGDYMIIPSVEERFNHSGEIDFDIIKIYFK